MRLARWSRKIFLFPLSRGKLFVFGSEEERPDGPRAISIRLVQFRRAFLAYGRDGVKCDMRRQEAWMNGKSANERWRSRCGVCVGELRCSMGWVAVRVCTYALVGQPGCDAAEWLPTGWGGRE